MKRFTKTSFWNFVQHYDFFSFYLESEILFNRPNENTFLVGNGENECFGKKDSAFK